ncbi:tRNA (adenosine(37)-N6)-dimethylallyltransferase MiaA [Caldinitratiruptor microaerophilus]|uniref:tRNA dimethylallyltransferase n=1 Tax=Caldinitratiruptor microaerophilus TaxID=671077 RepID=A0AA35CIY0_9FIRM|nr:tRNA (adenosine(37)-N6)-dimethylallyltransferase MiaA [Caldinitratiruptor microaerophilus]BDG60002.1 tRNA dimethylallyltransferase [Caldinitratiruptor microaerophilus]
MRPGPLLAIVGPTAVGKTAVAIEVALRLRGEVISADSMQVYRGLDIGTAKPTPEERRGVPHHLIDICDPGENFSVFQFRLLADALIEDIQARGRLPILVGGTGFYVRAVLREYGFPELDPDPAIRRRLEEVARAHGPLALHERLRAVDPAAAERIHPHNVKRVIRALEVYEQTGQPISSLHRATWAPRYDALVVGLTLERSELYRRIEARTDAQLAAGWLEEVVRLVNAGVPATTGPLTGLGYRHLVGYLRGLVTWEEAVASIKRDTRRYAKRQFTWLRREEGVTWLDMAAGVEAVAAEIVRLVTGKWPGRVEKA